MPLKDSLESLSTETKGLVLGFIGVFCFSLTFPATRVAVRSLDPTFVGLGRSVVAGILAGFLLLITRQKLPSRDQIKSLLIVAAGVIVGFPLLSTWAMRRLPASHGAIIGGILPLVTIVVAAIRAGERPSRGFWGASLLGSMAVVLFAFVSGAQEAHLADLSADLALLGAVLAAAVGYAEGGRLARTMGGWRVICWALVLTAPLLAVPVLSILWKEGGSAPAAAWVGFGYVSLVSQFLAFFVWYQGLAIGGVARISQIQLLQPFLTILASAILLGETVTPAMIGFALWVIATVAVGRRMPVTQRREE